MITFNSTPHKNIMYDVIRHIEELNNICESIQGERIFRSVSLETPRFGSAELDFIRTVSWFYVLYYELGKVSIDYLNKLMLAYEPKLKEIQLHVTTIHQMRTYLQHHLDPSKDQNKQIQRYCQDWFSKNCKTAIPVEEEHWSENLISLLTEAQNYMKALIFCVRSLEKDDSKETIIKDWSSKKNRYHAPYEFDEVISIVVNDMGKDSLDIERLRKKYYQEWSNYFIECRSDYDFNKEARKLIESVLISDTPPLLPITGEDVIREFQIQPGPAVGNILKKARELYEAEQCSSGILLERLRKIVSI